MSATRSTARADMNKLDDMIDWSPAARDRIA
jgi:hypothetical protein